MTDKNATVLQRVTALSTYRFKNDPELRVAGHDEAIAILEPPPPASPRPWLPAHTAPKDGSPILVWINRAGLGVGVSAVRWDVDEKTWKRLGYNVTLPIGAFDEWISLGDLH